MGLKKLKSNKDVLRSIYLDAAKLAGLATDQDVTERWREW